MLNEVPAAVKHGLGPPAAQCEPQAFSGLLKKDELEYLGVDDKELELLSRKPGGDETSHVVNRPGYIPVRTGDEARDLSRVVGV